MEDSDGWNSLHIVFMLPSHVGSGQRVLLIPFPFCPLHVAKLDMHIQSSPLVQQKYTASAVGGASATLDLLLNMIANMFSQTTLDKGSEFLGTVASSYDFIASHVIFGVFLKLPVLESHYYLRVSAFSLNKSKFLDIMTAEKNLKT